MSRAEMRVLAGRQPQVWRIGSQRLAEESRRRDTGNGEGVPLDHQRRADNRGVAAVEALPRMIGQHHHWRRGGVVVVGREYASGECADSQRREVTAGDVHGAKRPRRLFHGLATYAHATDKCRER